MKTIPALLITVFSVCALSAQSPAGRPMNILVLPFTNTGGPQYGWIAAGMTDTVVADLQRLSSVNVFSEEERKKAVKEIELGMAGLVKEDDAVKAGGIMGAGVIFTGSYAVAGDAVRVVAKLVDVGTTRVTRTRKLDGTLNGIFDLQDRIVAALMEEVEQTAIKGVRAPRFTEKEKKAVKKGHRPPVAAFELYAKAMEKAETSPREALALALRAVKLDPNYAGALTMAGSMYTQIGDNTNADRYFALAQKALRDSGLADSPDYAMLIQNISLTAWNRGDNRASIDRGLEALKLWEKLGRKENSAYAMNLMVLGAAYRNMNDAANDLKYTARARDVLRNIGLERSSAYAWVLANLGVTRLSAGQYDEALALNNEALALWSSLGMGRSTGYAITYSQNGSVYYMKKDYGKALKFLLEGMKMCAGLGLDKTVQYAYFSWNAANSYWMQGQYCKGLPHMERSAAVFRSLGSAMAGQAEKALGDFKRQCGK